jgi:hypothetical protein
MLPIFGRMRSIPPMLNAGARISALICKGFDWIEPELELQVTGRIDRVLEA